MVTLEDIRNVREVERDAYRVEDVMSSDLTTVSPDTDAIDAISLMQEKGVGRLPVVDGDDSLVGLISRSDLVTAFNIIKTQGSMSSVDRELGRPTTGDLGFTRR